MASSVPAPVGRVRIRPETSDDVDAVRRVVAAAFGSEVQAMLVERIRSSPEYVPETALVADDEGEIVGHVMISRAVIRNQAGDWPISMLSPLAVTPARQRSGIGGALVRAVLSIADLAGEPLVILEGSPTTRASTSSPRRHTASRSTSPSGHRRKRRRSCGSRRSTLTIPRCEDWWCTRRRSTVSRSGGFGVPIACVRVAT